MTRALILFLGDNPEAPIAWGVIENGAALESGVIDNASALGDLARRYVGVDRTIALIPGEQATVRRIENPPKSAAKFKAAAAYLLEDALSEPIETIHYVVGVANGAGSAVSVKRSVMTRWKTAFEEASFSVDVLSADIAVLAGADEPTIIRGDARALAVTAFDAFACENDLFDLVAEEVLAEIETDRVVYLGEEAAAPARLRDKENDWETDWLGPTTQQSLLDLFARLLAKAEPPNLLSGQFRKPSEWRKHLAPWRTAATIAAGVIGLSTATIAADAWRNDRMDAKWTLLTQEMHALYFPDAENADPISNARRVLGTGEEERSFLSLSSVFAEAIDENGDVQIDRIGYDAFDGRFAVSVRSRSDASIEELRNALEERGVSVRDNGGYRRSRGEWVGELLAEQ